MSAAEEHIGRCDLCGLIDHHLVGGECPACRRGVARGSLRGRIAIESDTAGNKLIRIVPQHKREEGDHDRH